MRILLLLFLIIVFGASTFAQKFTITGQVLDTLSSPLPSATVMLLNPKDSSLVNFGVSDARGVFEMKNVSKGPYQLKITFVGFAPLTKTISTSEKSVVDVGQLKMEPLTKQ